MTDKRIVSQLYLNPLPAHKRPRFNRPGFRLVEDGPVDGLGLAHKPYTPQAPHPRVVMVPRAPSQRLRARRQLAAIYLIVGLILIVGWALPPSGVVAEPGDAPAAITVGEHDFIEATPTATVEPALVPAVEPVDHSAPAAVAARLWPGFSPSVLHWEPLIVKWSDALGIDPNQAATIMQVESCGDPQAISRAGAQGLFQVMPFHFAAGEDSLDPDTNARRGLTYFVERLNQTDGDVGRAFAGYNGGQRAAASSWDQWPNETQRYYLWTTGIMAEIGRGQAESETLQQWFRAGGASLCNQAAARLGLP